MLEKNNSPTICAVPWMHLNFEPSGRVMPCCLTSTYNYDAGDLNTQTIDEIWNSDNQKQLRQQMLNGEEPKICHKCFDRERVAGESGRIHHNKEFKHVLETIPNITLNDGTCTEMKLRYWDFRFSNICNLKCRSCGPRYSSAWIPDARKLGWDIGENKVINIEKVENKNNYDFLEEQVSVVEKIYFAGGEPLLMPEHWQTLDLLVKHNRFDVRICYNTNCTTLSYNGKNILDYWSRWQKDKLEVWPSIDEIGNRAELIRSGTVWNKVESNLKEIAKYENINIRPGITVGCMNVFRLPEIVEHLVNIGIITKRFKYTNFYLNLLEEPNCYHVSILSDEYRKNIVERLVNWIEHFNKQHSTDIGPKFTQILHELKKPLNVRGRRAFVDITKKLDTIRNENTIEIIPELGDVL